MYQCLAHRAIKPGHVLPEVAPDLKALMSPPEEVLAKAKEILKKIDGIFPRQEIGAKKEKVTAEKMFADKKRYKFIMFYNNTVYDDPMNSF